jgi:hypothetical protein
MVHPRSAAAACTLLSILVVGDLACRQPARREPGTTSVDPRGLNYPWSGVPRTLDGKVNLAAPAPRTLDGKPDFSGVWGMDAGPALFFIPAEPASDARARVEALLQERDENFQKDDPSTLCLPEGPRLNHFLAVPKKIVQTPTLIIELSEDLSYRQIFLDDRPLPEDPIPSFMGYSVGRWEGDTLIVESTGYKDRTWLDFAGHPHSEALRLIERWRRLDVGRMEIEETFADPETYVRSFNVTVAATLVPDTDLIEFVCAENESDRPKLVGTLTRMRESYTPVKVRPELLAQYVGTYDFRFPENPTVPSMWRVTMAEGTLFLTAAPLVPVAEDRFLFGGTPVQFFKDEQGNVTHFTATFVEGDLVARRVTEKK